METVAEELKKREDQVKYLLEKYPPTRDNDFYLTWLWLKIFAKIDLPFLDWRLIRRHGGSLETVRRVRADIQNKQGLFPPTEGTRLKRWKRKWGFRNYFAGKK